MSEKPVIFISHSSKDEELALVLKQQIELCFDSQVEVFVARYSLEPSQDWLNEIIQNLEDAEALIILMTPSSKTSYWVGFEVGHVWEKISLQKLIVYPIRLPRIEVFGPFWQKHAVLLDRSDEVKRLFQNLGNQFDHEISERVDLDKIMNAAQKSTKQYFESQNIAIQYPDKSPEDVEDMLSAKIEEYLEFEFRRWQFYGSRGLIGIADFSPPDNIFGGKYISYSEFDSELKMPPGTAKRLLKSVAISFDLEILGEKQNGIRFRYDPNK